MYADAQAGGDVSIIIDLTNRKEGAKSNAEKIAPSMHSMTQTTVDDGEKTLATSDADELGAMSIMVCSAMFFKYCCTACAATSGFQEKKE